MKRVTDRTKHPDTRLITVGVCIFLVAVVWIVFGQTLRHEFVNYDDDRYVYKNPRTASGLTLTNVRWAFTHYQVANWHPLTMISHMLDCQLYGLQPWGHHLTNVLLHATAAVLLFLALLKLTVGEAVGFVRAGLASNRDASSVPYSQRRRAKGEASVFPAVIDRRYSFWASAFVAALFAIHPLRVESVAWVAERKDVLSGVFFMLTLLAYARYVQSEKKSFGRYLTVIIFFALGLMCKPTLVTLPFLLLLLDYWPLGRWQSGRSKELRVRTRKQGVSAFQLFSFSAFRNVRGLVVEKIPLFVLSAASCVITIFAQAGAFATVESLSFHQRLANAIVTYVQYLGETIYPAHLAVLYPYSKDGLQTADILLPLTVLCIVSIVLFLWRKTFPFLLVGWFWFLGMLVPMIGLVQVGSQARADRYTYLPAIGLYILAAWGALALFTKWQHGQKMLAAVALAIVAALGIRSYFQGSYWQNSDTLWKHTIAITSGNYIAHNNLANSFLEKGRFDDAIAEAVTALAMRPGSARVEATLGNSYMRKGDMGSAALHYQRALALRPDYAEVQSNLGNIFLDKGDVDQAILHYENALAVEPDYPGLHSNLGNALLHKGDADAAIVQYQKALEIDPSLAEAHNNFGTALLQKAQVDAAIAQYQRALTLKPDYPEAQYNLGIAFAGKGNYTEAITHFNEALRLKPDYAEARKRLGELGVLSP